MFCEVDYKNKRNDAREGKNMQNSAKIHQNMQHSEKQTIACKIALKRILKKKRYRRKTHPIFYLAFPLPHQCHQIYLAGEYPNFPDTSLYKLWPLCHTLPSPTQHCNQSVAPSPPPPPTSPPGGTIPWGGGCQSTFFFGRARKKYPKFAKRIFL